MHYKDKKILKRLAATSVRKRSLLRVSYHKASHEYNQYCISLSLWGIRLRNKFSDKLGSFILRGCSDHLYDGSRLFGNFDC